MARRLAALVRQPFLHFVVLGGLAFLANGWWQGRDEGGHGTVPRETILVSAQQIEQIRRDFERKHGFNPSAAELADSVDEAIDEEILFRQARAIGLDRNNAAVYRRLVQIARFVSDNPGDDDAAHYRMAVRLGLDRSDEVVRRHLAALMRLVAANAPIPGERPPDAAELAAYVERHRERFLQPRQVRLSHIYFSDDDRGARAEADARQLLHTLRRTSVDPVDAVRRGDSFLLGHHLAWQTSQSLRVGFGKAFADALATVGPGAWEGPFRSAYGWHLVWVHEIREPALPDLETVSRQAFSAVMDERRSWRVDETLKRMRARYSIEVEAPVTDTAHAARTDANG